MSRRLENEDEGVREAFDCLNRFFSDFEMARQALNNPFFEPEAEAVRELCGIALLLAPISSITCAP